MGQQPTHRGLERAKAGRALFDAGRLAGHVGSMRAYLRYEGAVVRAAWASTFHVLKKRASVLVDGILWAIGAVVYWSWQGPEQAKGQVIEAIAFGLVPVVALALVIGVWNLCVTPYRLHRQLDRETTHLKATATDTKDRRKILGAMTGVYRTGHALLNESVTSDAVLEGWKKRVGGWQVVVLTLIRHTVSVQAASRLQYIVFDVRRFQKAFNKEHDNELNGLNRRLEILDALMQQYEKLSD